MTTENFDLIVIGEGIAGMTAAGHAARAGLSTATFEGTLFGGLVMNINHLDPAPSGDGAPTVGSGADLAAELLTNAIEAGVTQVGETASAIERTPSGFVVRTDSGAYGAKQVIIASGARLRTLGVPGEADLAGRGVSTCADCDGPMFRGKEVVVVGGGDSALQEALALAEWCERVHVVHRRDHFSGRADLAERVKSNPKIKIHWDMTIDAIEGADGVERVLLRAAGVAHSTYLDCAGVFAYTGLDPNTAFVPAEIARDADGRLQTNTDRETAWPGLYAAGIVRSGCGGTADDAIADGRAAAARAVARR